MLEADDSLTHEQVLERFRRVFGRDMTPEEQPQFFIPCSFSAKRADLVSKPKEK